MVYRNRNFTKRDYECSNVVACVADRAPVTPDCRWVEDDEGLLAGLTQLEIVAGVRFYGYL